jgi:cell division protein FtsN
VIVPDFGGFVANYRSAVVDEIRQKIHPPSKSVLFNPHLTNNDGLLGNYVAQQRKSDYLSALEFIADAVKSWKNDLSEGQRIEIGEVGFLYEEKGAIHFEQSRELNLLMQAYGLRSIDFVNFNTKPNKVEQQVNLRVEEKVEEKKEPVKELSVPIEREELSKHKTEKVVVRKKKITVQKDAVVIAMDPKGEVDKVIAEQRGKDGVIPIRRGGRAKTVVKYAAAAAVVPILFYSYWIPMETDFLETKLIHFSDFNPVHAQSEKRYKKRENQIDLSGTPTHQTWEELTENINASVYNYELSEDFYVPILLSNGTDEVVVEDVHEEIQLNDVISGNYQIIAGCFSVKANADNLVSELSSQGYAATILDKSKGLHRVTAGGYTSREDANIALDNLRNTGKSGWILKK